MRRVKLFTLTNATLVLCCSVVSAAQSREPEGCYFATPALTYSASGNPERGDSSWAVLHLRSAGAAIRPLLRKGNDARSAWRWVGDTLEVIVSDGLAGWRLALSPTEKGWVGTGSYLTDVLVVGPYERPRVRFTLERRACGTSSP